MTDFLNDPFPDMEAAGSSHVVPIITEFHAQAPDDKQQQATDLQHLPILPLRNSVLFPGITIPISVGRESSMRLLQEVQDKGTSIGVVCQTDKNNDDPAFDDLYKVGTMATVIKVLELPDGSTNVILHGNTPFTLNALVATKPYLLGDVTVRAELEPQPDDREFRVLMKAVLETTRHIIDTLGDGAKELGFAVKNIKEPKQLVNFLSTHIPFETRQKQQLLEIAGIKERALELYSMLEKESQLIDLKANITSRTREDLSQQQREHFLLQQLRTIQEELGGGSDDIEQLNARADKMLWGDKVRAQFDKEIKKLERFNPQSPDYSVQYTFIDNLLNLPWNVYSEDNFDLKRAERKLNADHYGLEKVKDRILEQLAVLKLRGDLKAPILCLFGPPGVGKTSLGRSIAEALGRKYARISLGGLHDEAEIRGHRRTYIGAMPGRILAALQKCGTSNPVIVLDEIDKVGQDYKGDPSSALLEVLDPEQNGHFHDNYIDIDYDLSKVLFIATANSLQTISQPLLDRMEVIEINSYIIEEKVEIARRHLVPKQLKENGFEPKEVAFPKATLQRLATGFTRESGVRELEKRIGQVLRKVARLKASGKPFPATIGKEQLTQLLGSDKFRTDAYEGNEFAGVVTGLAWTSVGGEILFIESSLSAAGKSGDKLTLTGNLGDVMKESAVIALQYIKAHAKQLGIDPAVFDRYNVHIHVPEGAIPKDGPSAGVTMVTSLVSSFTQRKVRPQLAMTGEITLRGKVLPVGGIKEKVLAAKRAGIKDVMLCRDNKRDIDEIQEIYTKGLTFHYADTIGDVIDFALLPEKVKGAVQL